MQAQLARMAAVSRQKALDAQSKAEKIALTARNEKREAWNRIQIDLPSEAQWLTKMGVTFGRLAKVEVTNLETGEIFKIR